MKKLGEFLPHLSICLLLCLGVFTVLDGYNPYMKWLTSGVSKVYIAICCIVGIITAVMLIVRQRRRKKRSRANADYSVRSAHGEACFAMEDSQSSAQAAKLPQERG